MSRIIVPALSSHVVVGYLGQALSQSPFGAGEEGELKEFKGVLRSHIQCATDITLVSSFDP